MAKLVLRADDGSTTEFGISKERLTIGRRSDNDICLTNAAVSAEHAVIVSILSDSYLEDLASTNGTFVNGKPIKRHLLQNADVVEIGRHRLIFEADQRYAKRLPPRMSQADFERGQAGTLPEREAMSDAPSENSAMLLVLNGSRSGEEVVLDKDLVSLGKAGLQVVTITRRPHGYFITHVEGKELPKVNGKAVETQTYPLYAKDVIELGEIRLQFMVGSPS
jgi:hypothetical protein